MTPGAAGREAPEPGTAERRAAERGAAPRIGLYFDLRNPDGAHDWHELYESTLARVAEAERLAGVIAKRSPLALAVGKEILNRDSWEGYQYAVEAIALLQGSEDAAEGLRAFRERRDAAFGDG